MRILRDCDESVYFRKLFFQLRFVTLRKTAHDNESLKSFLLIVCSLQDCMNGFRFGAFNKTTGIDNYCICLMIGSYDFQAVFLQQSQQIFRIHKILGTAKRNHSDFH